MILLNHEKSKKKFIKIMQNYLNLSNYGHLDCPFCHSSEFIRWGHYDRNVIFFKEDNLNLESSIITIQRVRCKSCGKTHALLPFGIIPYKQFTSEVVMRILLESLTTSLEKLANKYLINISILKTFDKQFKNIHLSRIVTLMKNNNILNILTIFSENVNYEYQYVIKNNRCFMQFKLGCLSLSPS